MNDKILKAPGALTCKIRFPYVNVRDDGTVEATKGAALIKITGYAHTLPPGQYDAKKAIAKIKADVAPEPVADAAPFPDVDHVIVAESEDGGTPHGMDAGLMVDVWGALNTIASALDARALNVYRVQPGTASGPTRISANMGGVDVVCVVMPCRL